jgi:GWxTD domain-containing protein
VDIITTERERDVFLQITDDIERDKFIDEFWRRRSEDKDGVRPTSRRSTERVEYAKETSRT